MKILFSLLILSLFIFNASAQFINTTSSDAAEIKKRILLVALPLEDKDVISEYELNHKDYIDPYKEDFEGQRIVLKETVLKYWKFSDSIVVLPFKDAKVLMKKNPEKYAMMRYGDKVEDRIYVGQNSRPPFTSWNVDGGIPSYKYYSRYNNLALSVTSLVIDIPKRVIEVFLPKMSPSEGDFIYAIKQMEYILSTLIKKQDDNAKRIFKEAGIVSPQLKDKILLIDVAELNAKEGLTDEEAVKKYYPFPVKLVQYEELQNILKTGDSKYAIIVHARHDYENSTYSVVNASDGTIYFNAVGPTFKYGDINGTQYSIRIYYPFINRLDLEIYSGANKTRK